MPPAAVHRRVAAAACRVPPPFRAFAVRSDEACHAFDARAPYDRIHLVRGDILDAATLASLAVQGYPRLQIEDIAEVAHATTTLEELSACAPHRPDVGTRIAAALQLTGLLGPDLEPYRNSVAARIDYLGSRGAGFHNDVKGRWSRSLFWVLALDLADVEFVMPHAGVQLPLARGDLLVFDPTMAHGLCRCGDGGQVLENSFAADDASRQIFLTGELLLADAQWAALGSPWLPVEQHDERAALDLMVAEFDDRSGAIKRPNTLRDCLKRSTCYVDDFRLNTDCA
jgi:hypothetical protein